MSPKELRKRARERFFLDEFLRQAPGLQFVKHGQPPEWPDFVVTDDVGQLGVEMTQLFCDDGPTGSPTAAAEMKRADCLIEIARRYYAAGGPPADVVAARLDHEGRNVDDAVRLLRKAADRRTGGPHCVRVPDRSKRWARPWAELQLTMLSPAVGQHTGWTARENSAGWVASLTPQALSGCIAAKTANLPRYRLHLERVVLLIYVERNRASGMIEPASDQLRVSAAGFVAVYLLLWLREGGPQLLRVDAR